MTAEEKAAKREQELKDREKAIDERENHLKGWERELKNGTKALDKRERELQDREEQQPAAPRRRDRDALPAMACPTCGAAANITPGKDKSLISICENQHKHVHGAGLLKKLRDQQKAEERAAVRSFPCPTCNKEASLVNDPDSDDGSAISECAAGHRHTLSNTRRKSLGIPTG